MPKSRKDIHHLNAGEWSRKVYNRIDHEKHASACRQAKNVISWTHGAVTKRKGFEFVAPAKYDGRKFRPVRFRFSKADSLCLEMGHKYVRFHANGEQIREAPIDITATTAADPVVATAASHGYSDGDEIYVDGMTEMVELNGRWLIVANSTTNTFELRDRDGNDIDGSTWTAESTGGTSEKVYEIASVYAEDDLYNLDYAQKNDVMWFVDGSNPVQQLVRLGATNWTFGEYDFSFPPALDPNVLAGRLINVSGTTGTGLTMTAAGHTPFVPEHVGSYWVLRHFRKADEVPTKSSISAGNNITANAVKALGRVTFETSGNWTGEVTVFKAVVENPNLSSYTVDEWTEVGSYSSDAGGSSDGKNYNVSFEQENEARYYFSAVTSGSVHDGMLRSEAALIEGAVKVTGYTSSTVLTVDVVKDLESTDDTEDWSEGAWSDVQGYPAAICLFEKAIWYARTDAFPQGIWKSETDLYDSFKVGDEDTDGLFIELDSKERNDILWMSDSDKLLIGTSGSEWILSGTDLNSIISPTNIVARRQQNHGSVDIRPETVEDRLMYVQRGSNSDIRAYGYNIERDKYHGTNMQNFSQHLTAGGIKAMAFQAAPDPILWCCTNDGKLLSFTYERDQEVYAWNPHDTAGTFEGVETIYGATDDEVWVATSRTINGQTRRFVERMSGYFNPSINFSQGFKQEGEVQILVVFDGKNGAFSTERPFGVDAVQAAANFIGSKYNTVEYAFRAYGSAVYPNPPLLDPDRRSDFGSYTSIVPFLESFDTNSVSADAPSPSGSNCANDADAIIDAINAVTWDDSKEHMVWHITYSDDLNASPQWDASRVGKREEVLRALSKVNARYFHGLSVSGVPNIQALGKKTGGGLLTTIDDDFVGNLNSSILTNNSLLRFEDCSKRITQNSDTTIRGLWHLEGEEVEILADGYYIDGKTVANGAITLDETYSTIFVGLKYEAIVQPLQLNADGNVGSSKGYTKVMSAVYADLIDTIGLKYSDGSKDSNGETKYRDVSFRTGEQDQSLPPQIFNGEVELMTNTGHERDPIIILKSSDPLPFTLAGLVMHYDVTGE